MFAGHSGASNARKVLTTERGSSTICSSNILKFLMDDSYLNNGQQHNLVKKKAEKYLSITVFASYVPNTKFPGTCDVFGTDLLPRPPNEKADRCSHCEE